MIDDTFKLQVSSIFFLVKTTSFSTCQFFKVQVHLTDVSQICLSM